MKECKHKDKEFLTNEAGESKATTLFQCRDCKAIFQYDEDYNEFQLVEEK